MPKQRADTEPDRSGAEIVFPLDFFFEKGEREKSKNPPKIVFTKETHVLETKEFIIEVSFEKG